jgi:hypothetical protein
MEDETWVRPSEQQAMEWHRITTPRKKKFQSAISWKNCGLSFWKEKDVTLAKFLVKRTSVNSKCHIEMLRSLNARLDPFFPMR